MVKVIVETEKYKANDGTLHSSAKSCIEYERVLKLDKVWIVFDKRKRVRDFGESIEIFSTEELARESLKYVKKTDLTNYATLKTSINKYLR